MPGSSLTAHASSFDFFGLPVLSDLPLISPFPPSATDPKIFLHWVSQIPRLLGKSHLLYESPHRTLKGKIALRVEERAGSLLFSFPTCGRFLLRDDEIWCETDASADRRTVEQHLLNKVLTFVLEARGRTVLHGSGVRMGRGAVGFLAHQGGGKSTLAANLVQLGSAFVTDDLLVIERQGDRWVVHPGPAEVRLWPKTADHFVSDISNWEEARQLDAKRRLTLRRQDPTPVGPWTLPLSRLYLPVRQSRAPHVSPVAPRDAIIELIRYSFLARLTDAAGIAGDRLERLGAIAQAVPLARLYYNSGFDGVDQLAQLLAANCNSAS